MKNCIVVEFVVVCAVACQEDPQGSTRLSSETTDSAGIRIVENARPPGRLAAGLADRS